MSEGGQEGGRIGNAFRALKNFVPGLKREAAAPPITPEEQRALDKRIKMHLVDPFTPEAKARQQQDADENMRRIRESQQRKNEDAATIANERREFNLRTMNEPTKDDKGPNI